MSWPLWVRQNLGLSIALGISIAFHAALLTIRFVAPEVFNQKAQDPGLEVVLVNTRSERAPTKAEVLAQVALDGGGDKDRGRATSPLPNVGLVHEGDSLQESRRRLEQLEAEQKNLMSSMKTPRATLEPLSDKKTPSDASDQTAADLVDNAKALARQAAIVEARIEEENKRPKKHIFGTSAKDYVAAMYVDAFRNKVERWGNLNYPEEAKGRLYGQVQLTVVIDKIGQIYSLEIDHTSGSKVLDHAALNIVRRAAPYGRFTSQMMGEHMDLLSITRTMIFSNDELQARK